jgi:thiol-disulfide isomerase/thioredoxin
MLSLETAVVALALLGSGQGETVLLDFYADWCIPCRQMDPAVQELAAKGYPVRKVNIDRDRALARQFHVENVPCFVMLVDGREVEREVGGTTYSRLEQMCQLAQACKAGPQSPPRQGAAPPPGPARTLPPYQAPAPSDPSRQQSPAEPPAPGTYPPASAAGWRQSTSGPQDPTDPLASLVDQLIAVTVRLRIEDPQGHSCGSGTIIDARNGEALILTCAHIFRDSKGQGRIEVDLFGPSPAERILGRLLSYDLDRDVALLTIPIRGPVVAARVASPGYQAAPQHRVVNVGCNNGERPTARQSHITAVDRYLGPPNLEVAGMPVLGRSGGGLFSEEGQVIGVCMAADDRENRGLYSALGAIHAELDKAGLGFVYRSGAESSLGSSAVAAVEPPAVPRRMPPLGDVARSGVAPVAPSADRAFGRGRPDRRETAARGQLSGQEQAALEEIRRRRQEGAEVVCVIRSRSDPTAPSEIIVLDRVSSGFLNQLAAEGSVERPSAAHFTSLEISDPAGASRVPGQSAGRGTPDRPPLIEYRTADRGATSASRYRPEEHAAVRR